MITKLTSFVRTFRPNIIMSAGYVISIMSTMLMYTLLPSIVTGLWNESIAGLFMVSMTALQVFVFNPIFAHLTDTYSARKMFFAYTGAFVLGALLWLLSYYTGSIDISKILIIGMVICFAIGFGARYLDVYTLRITPTSHMGVGFGILVTFAALGRFISTMVQPYFLGSEIQIFAPVIMIIAMIIFSIIAWKLPDDHQPHLITITTNTLPLHIRIIHVIKQGLIGYKESFTHAWRFIKRCSYYPLVPLTFSLWEGLLFGSLWFIVPLYAAKNPDIMLTGFELGVYEIISLFTAIAFGILADKSDNRIGLLVGRIGALSGMILLYLYPSLSMLISAGILIGISNSLLYASSQHILSDHDIDHEDDGAYAQVRSLITNIGFMTMPIMRGFIHVAFEWKLHLFASMMISIAILGIIAAFYVFVMKTKLWQIEK